jgi:hypothetical protein
MRVELYAAAQMLKGEDLAEFTKLIREIAEFLEIAISPLGSTEEPPISDVHPRGIP